MFGGETSFWDAGARVEYAEATGFVAPYNEKVGEIYLNRNPCLDWVTPTGTFALRPLTNDRTKGFTGRMGPGAC